MQAQEPSSEPVAAPAAAPAARPRRWLGTIVTLLLIAALAGGAWWLVQRAKAPSAAGAGAGAGGGGPRGGPGGPGGPGGGGGVSTTVGSALARQGDLPVLVDALGTITPPTTITLQPQVSGTLIEVLFTEGQMVQKGQVLARIDARPYQQALVQAQGQRARDEAQLAAARVTLQRYQTLWKQDSIARQEVDTQAALVKQLEGTVQADRASEQAAQLNVNFSTLRAPISGLIGLRTVDPGNLVSSGSAGGIATITQITPIDVVFAVPQDRVPAVREAQQAHARAGGAGGSLPVTAMDSARTKTLAEGRFMTLDNQIDTATGTVKAKARFANADGALYPNQFVNVRLQLGTTPGVLVPVTAVRTGPEGDYVYVIDDERVAHMRNVKRGLATVEQILITSGLQAGERVVTEGGDRVKDGGKVQLAGSGPAGGASGAAAAGGRQGRRGGASAPGAAASGALSEANRPPAQSQQAPAATDSGASPVPAPAGASAPDAAASRPSGLDRLPPELRAKVLAMPPEERRAYLQQLREQRRAREAASGN